MGYFMVHLKTSQLLLKHMNKISNINAFYKGSLAPDAIMFREGCKRSDKETTHFCTGTEGWGFYTNYSDWMDSLVNSINKCADIADRDFLTGYFSHIYTDILYTKRFWTPIRLTRDDEYIQKYASDIFEIDSRLMYDFQNKDQIWSYLKSKANFVFPSFCTEADFSKLVHSMTEESYKDRHPTQNYSFNVVTYDDMIGFINETIKSLIDLFNKRICRLYT